MFRPLPKRLVSALALVVLGAACGTAQSIEVERIQRADVKVLPGAEGFTNPLTGATSYLPQDWQQRPALGIKIGNSAPERPQAGLDRADVVYEEIVEGGVTRFLALYLTNQAPRVGPVRSVRTVDHKIMEPIGGLFGYSGGVPPVIAELRAKPSVTDVGANAASGAYRRDGARQAPYNLYTATDQLWSGRDGSPPEPLFTFLGSDEEISAGGDEVANQVRMSFAGNGSEVKYVFDEKTGTYQRFTGTSPHTVEAEGGPAQLSFTNVLVQMVSTSAGATVDTAGERSTDIHMLGKGSAVLFRGGRALRGTWSRPGAGDKTTFTGSDGQPLRLAPGTTIVELIPQGRDIFVT